MPWGEGRFRHLVPQLPIRQTRTPDVPVTWRADRFSC
jgi:hypothetical protein